jgi:hypothetical protein
MIMNWIALTINIKIHNMKEDGVTTLSKHG